MGGKDVSFTFKDDAEASAFRTLAEYRGMSIQGLIRVALYDYRNRHPGPQKKPAQAAAVLSRAHSEGG